MTYKEETYVLNTLEQIQDFIKSPELSNAIKEIHENNKMLKEIIKVINMWLSNHTKENEDDFGRNVLANLISNMMEFRRK